MGDKTIVRGCVWKIMFEENVNQMLSVLQENLSLGNQFFDKTQPVYPKNSTLLSCFNYARQFCRSNRKKIKRKATVKNKKNEI